MSLIVWLPLNGNLENQGLSNVTVTNNGATVDNNGKIGKCYSFGSAKRITVAQPANLSTTAASLSCWVNLSAWGSSYDSLVNLSTGTGWNDTRLAFVRNNTANRIGFCIANGSTYNFTVMTSDLPLNTWTHLTGTFDGSTIKIYVNGVLNNSTATTFNALVYGSAVLNLGSWSNANNYPINGKLNDVRVYDHCLSAKEVKELAKGLVLHYRLAGPGQSNLMPNTSNKIQSTNVTTNYNILYSISGSQMEKGAKYVYSGYFENTGTKIIRLRVQWYNSGSDRGGPMSSININPGDKGFYYLPFTYTNGTYNTFQLGMDGNSNTAITSSTYNYAFVKLERGSVQTPWCPNPADSLYSIMGYNNNIEYDCSGFKNNGTKSSSITWDIDSPRYTTSYKFNGAEAIKKNNFIFTTNKWTISLWYKYSSAPTAYESLCCLSKGDGSDTNKKIAIMPNTNYIWFKTENTSYTLQSLKINEWCHLAITCDGTKAIIYENAVQKGTTSPSSFYTDTSDLVVGARSSSSGAETTSVYSKAKISDFRIYATTLSAEDIAELYHTAAIVDNQNNMYAYEYVEEEAHA